LSAARGTAAYVPGHKFPGEGSPCPRRARPRTLSVLANRWQRLPAMPFPRSQFAMAWTGLGTGLLVWGGYYGGRNEVDGAAFKIAV
jgi:hypothetical protein